METDLCVCFARVHFQCRGEEGFNEIAWTITQSLHVKTLFKQGPFLISQASNVDMSKLSAYALDSQSIFNET